jgi:hypothetical protein
MFRRSGYRFPDKNMRQRKSYSHFPQEVPDERGSIERKWL